MDSKPAKVDSRPAACKLLRFGLRTVFLIVIAAAALLTSYRAGFEHGRKRGPIVPIDASSDLVYTREYDVADIVKSDVKAREVLKSLRQLAVPETWDLVGGFAEAFYDSKKGTFVVSHVWDGHTSVIRFLSTVRQNLGAKGVSYALRQAEWEWQKQPPRPMANLTYSATQEGVAEKSELQ